MKVFVLISILRSNNLSNSNNERWFVYFDFKRSLTAKFKLIHVGVDLINLNNDVTFLRFSSAFRTQHKGIPTVVWELTEALCDVDSGGGCSGPAEVQK